MKSLRLVAMATALVALVCVTAAAQQAPQEPSVAEAARKARQQKPGVRATRVFTNDNLPTGTAGVSVGAPSASSGGEARGAASAEDEKQRADLEAGVEQAKQELAVMKKDLELLTRDFNLQRQQFYSNPGYSSDRAGKAALDQLEGQKNQKQQEVQQAEEKLKGLEEELKALNEQIGPKKGESGADEKALQAKLQSLRSELAKVEGQLSRIRSEAAAQGLTSYGPTVGGGFTADMIAQLEKRRAGLQEQIAELEDQARRSR